MKKWTKKFLNRKSTNNHCIGGIFENAKEAKKWIGLPEELWLELSEKNTLLETMKGKLANVKISSFMAGVAVGWAEKSKKIK